MRYTILMFILICNMSLADVGERMSVYEGATDRTTRTVTKSKQVVVSVDSHPSTGYRWYLKNWDRRVLIPIDYEYVSSNQKSKQLVGTPGVSNFKFLVQKNLKGIPIYTEVQLVLVGPDQKVTEHKIKKLFIYG